MSNHNYKSVNNPNGYTFNLEIQKLTEKMSSPVTTSDLKFTYADRTNNSREEVNIFSSFRLPVNTQSLTDFTTAFGPGLMDTSPEYLNQDVIIFAPIPKNEYGEMLDGKTIKFQLPTTGGTVDIYGTYSDFVQSNGDAVYSDPDQRLAGGTYALGSLTHDLVSNAAINPPNVSQYYKSNVCLLFSDTIAAPVAGGSWATGWGTTNPFAVGNKLYYKFDDYGSVPDQPVGIAYLDSGFIVITDPTLTREIDVSGMFNADGTPYVGGTTDFADIYYSSTTANAFFESMNSEYVLNVLCIAEATEFNTSQNPTYVSPSDVRITELALYGDNTATPGTPGELLAYGKLDRPVQKGSGDYISFVVQIKA